jgi:hypothetical protein
MPAAAGSRVAAFAAGSRTRIEPSKRLPAIVRLSTERRRRAASPRSSRRRGGGQRDREAQAAWPLPRLVDRLGRAPYSPADARRVGGVLSAARETPRRSHGSGEGVREDAATKAKRYLAEARVRVLHCDEEDGTIEAEVRGDGRIYAAGRDESGWRCDCAARTENCAHLRALRLISVLEPRESRP